MIALSKRLQCIANMVPPCAVLADVGTDHGYLPAWLLQSGRVERALASDVRPGPLQRARETAEICDLTDRMELYLADGLNYPCAERAQVITICGMGGETMISILSAAPWTANGRRLILQPQSKLTELEDWLFLNNYAITDARLCLDAGKYYLALSVLGGERGSVRAEDWLLRRQDPLSAAYFQKEADKTAHALDSLRLSAQPRPEQTAMLEHRLERLQKHLKETETW